MRFAHQLKSFNMKKIFLVSAFTSLLLFGVAPAQPASANPIVEIIRQAVIAVIKAMDLAVQRVQNETIRLQHIQKEIENAMSKLKLKEIAEWGEKQSALFKAYYDELWKVKSIIAQYKRIKYITQMQTQLVREYKKAFGLIKQDKHFTATELLYISEVYSGILEESVKNVEQLILVVSSFSTQMGDAQRLELINSASAKIDRNLSHLRQFTQQNTLLSIERARDQQEQLAIKRYYGID